MRRRPLLACLCVAAAFTHAAAETIAVKAKLLIDGTGGPPRKDPVVIVQEGKIFAIGTLVPTGATLVDLGDRTLLPGFIDCHVHLVGRSIGEGTNWEDAAVRDLPQEDAIRGVRNAQRTLAAGFTTVRNVGAEEFGDIALRNAIRDGVVPGPRILAAGHSIGITGGHCDTNGYAPGLLPSDPLHGIADGEAEIVKAIRLQVKHGADVIKTCATGGVLSEGTAVGVQQFDDDELQVLVREAHLAGRKVAAHAHGADGIKAALRAGVDSIEHGSMTDDEAIKLFKEKNAFLVPTLMAQESVERYAKEGVLKGERAEKALHIAPLARENLRKAFAAGVKVALGTDAGVFPHGTNGHEFELLVALGMRPMDAILAGTRNAAELLGLEKEIGTVEPGKIADLVAVDGNPLDDVAAMTKPSFVMHRGVVFTEPAKPEKKGLAKLFGK